MNDPTENISSEDFKEFRDVFHQFMQGQKSSETHSFAPKTDNLRNSLLDVLLKPDSDSDDNLLKEEIQNVIGRISEFSALELPHSLSATTSFLKTSFELKSDLLDKLINSGFESEKKFLWMRHINHFFDTFIYELVGRWEELESQRHLEELNNLKAGHEKLQRENYRLRGIYALSIEIATLDNANDIYRYIANKLPSIIPMDALMILDRSLEGFLEKVFPIVEISSSEIESGRQKLEDFYEIFQREVIDRKKVKMRITSPDKIKFPDKKVESPECIFVPILSQGFSFAIIGALRKAGNPFNPQEVQSISIIANLADLVLRNIKALDRESSMNKSHDDQIRFAKNVQHNVLPSDYKSDIINIKTLFAPSESISGDFYQFFSTTHNEQGVLIGDVTGHDVAAGLMMMTVMGILTEVFAMENSGITEMLARANLNLSRMVSDEFFVTSLTLWVTDANKLGYYNAGHPPGLLCRKDTQEIIELSPDGFPLGIFENITISPTEHEINQGDRILLYTDGLIEARDSEGNQFGIPRLKELFSSLLNTDCESALDKILKTIYDHAGTDEMKDDIAIVLVEKL